MGKRYIQRKATSNINGSIMKTEPTTVKAIRSKYWEPLQKLADENEMGNLNHLVNKIFHSYILSVGKKKKK